MEQDLSVIQHFNAAPARSLEILGQRLGLCMSRAELLFCARHYPCEHISVGTLRLIDALACPTHPSLGKIAIGELLTDHTYIAETYADAVSKLGALGKSPDKPFTLQDIADLSARYTAAMLKKDMAEPMGFGGTAAAYAAQGHGVQYSMDSTHGRFDVLQPLPIIPCQDASYADAIMLLLPAPDMDEQDFDCAVRALLCSEAGQRIRCLCDTACESTAHAVLRLTSGAVLNLAKLPEHLQDPCALAACRSGLLATLSQGDTPALTEAAQELGLCAYTAGIADHAGRLIFRHDKDELISLDVRYLRSICFIRSYTLRLEDEDMGNIPTALPLHAPANATSDGCDALDRMLRTHHAAYVSEASFRAAALCAMTAYCTAVAAGKAPAQIWLDAQILQNDQAGASHAAADMLEALLGLYRASMELGAPIRTHAAFTKAQSSVTALASAPLDTEISDKLQGQGKIYLLSPRLFENGLPVWSELRALIAYVRRAMQDGKIKSARVLCNQTPADALRGQSCDIMLNPHASRVSDSICPCAFLLQTDDELAGELIALSIPPKGACNETISDNIS